MGNGVGKCGVSQAVLSQKGGKQTDSSITTLHCQGVFDPLEWISQAEAARILNVSRQAVAWLVKNGRLNTLRIGGTNLVRREEVEAFQPEAGGRPKQR